MPRAKKSMRTLTQKPKTKAKPKRATLRGGAGAGVSPRKAASPPRAAVPKHVSPRRSPRLSPVRKIVATSPSLRPRRESMAAPQRPWFFGKPQARPSTIVARMYNLLAREPKWNKYFDVAYAPAIVAAAEAGGEYRFEVLLLRPDGMPIVTPTSKLRAEIDVLHPKLRPTSKKMVLTLRADGYGAAHAAEVPLFLQPANASAQQDMPLVQAVRALRLMGMYDARGKGQPVNLCKLRLY